MPAEPLSLRQEIALAHVETTGRGLEIGPAYEPLAPKRQGFNVTVLDHAPQAVLLEKYGTLPPEKLSAIEEVDCIWDGGPYRDTPGLKPPYDYIIASHVIEHTLDPVGFLEDLSSLLTPDGRIALVVPDHRCCFDHHRPLTSVGQVIDAHYRPSAHRQAGAVFDNFAYHVSLEGQLFWVPEATGEFTQTYSVDRAWEEALAAVEGPDYVDVHRWVFTPSSLELILATMSRIGWLNLRIVGSHPTAGIEFFLTLGHGSRVSEDEVRRLLLENNPR
jgi:SAM-dependent methyltransferase